MAKTNGKMIANNKKAYHDYFILDTYEAGIVLHGTEVKSLRMGKCSIKESFIRIENGEVFIYGMHISPYEKGNIFNKDPLRVKKLMLHKAEINKLIGKTKEKGMAIVPLKVYFKGSLVKVEIGLAKGKKLYDKRLDIAKKDQQREAIRDFKIRNLGYDERKCAVNEDKNRKRHRKGGKYMVPVKKEDLRKLVTDTTVEIYEELTPQLVKLIQDTKKNTELTEGQKQDEISLHMMGYVKTCTNEIIIQVLSEILGLEDEDEE